MALVPPRLIVPRKFEPCLTPPDIREETEQWANTKIGILKAIKAYLDASQEIAEIPSPQPFVAQGQTEIITDYGMVLKLPELDIESI